MRGRSFAGIAAAIALSSFSADTGPGPGLDPMSPPPTITRFGRSTRFGGRGMKADQRRAKKRRAKKRQRRR